MDDEDVKMLISPNVSLEDVVVTRALGAQELGADGVIASGREASLIRQVVKPDFLIVTPGIRMPGDNPNEQKRTSTPYEAVFGGADFIVVGRPIIDSGDPRATANRMVEEIRRARADRAARNQQ
jgi:orotidine-5'-phosphate decarboxylase